VVAASVAIIATVAPSAVDATPVRLPAVEHPSSEVDTDEVRPSDHLEETGGEDGGDMGFIVAAVVTAGVAAAIVDGARPTHRRRR
jgi:hypothetical protein